MTPETSSTGVCDTDDLLLDSILDYSRGIRNGVSFQGKIIIRHISNDGNNIACFLKAKHKQELLVTK